MITNLLLDIVKTLCDFIVAALPSFSVSLPPSMLAFCSWIMNFNAWFPVLDTLILCSLTANIVALVSAVKWTIKVVDYIMDVIP